MSTDTAPQTRGRPRDPAIDAAILDAARSVIAQRGYTGASMEQIARTAGVGKDTLYRRWDSKQALVRQLLTVMADEHVPYREADADPSYALFLFLRDIVQVNLETGLGAVIAGVVGEAARNPDLAATFHEFWRERREVSARMVRAVVGPDPSEDELDRTLDRARLTSARRHPDPTSQTARPRQTPPDHPPPDLPPPRRNHDDRHPHPRHHPDRHRRRARPPRRGRRLGGRGDDAADRADDRPRRRAGHRARHARPT